jgi:hypothetical protein
MPQAGADYSTKEIVIFTKRRLEGKQQSSFWIDGTKQCRKFDAEHEVDVQWT